MNNQRTLGKIMSLSTPKEDHWIPLADVMTGLMMMFLLIAVIFMYQVQEDVKKQQLIAQTYYETRIRLYEELEKEFRDDLKKWNAELDRNLLSIRFQEPDVLFDSGQAELKQRFRDILDDFFPRYVRILSQPTYRNSIEEIRIEGHTSSVWKVSVSPDAAYFLNMELSQDRTRSVLQYVLSLPSIASNKAWLQAHLTANGLSSSKLRMENGNEDARASRRVEFRVRTDADARIVEMLQVSDQ